MRTDQFKPLFQLPSIKTETQDSQGRTLLLAACTRRICMAKKIECANGIINTPFQELLDRGADATAQDNSGKCVLHYLVVYKGPNDDDLANVKAILTRNSNVVHIADRSGNTPLHCVMRNSEFKYADLLLEHGADPLQPDSEEYVSPILCQSAACDSRMSRERK